MNVHRIKKNNSLPLTQGEVVLSEFRYSMISASLIYRTAIMKTLGCYFVFHLSMKFFSTILQSGDFWFSAKRRNFTKFLISFMETNDFLLQKIKIWIFLKMLDLTFPIQKLSQFLYGCILNAHDFNQQIPTLALFCVPLHTYRWTLLAYIFFSFPTGKVYFSWVYPNFDAYTLQYLL